MEGAKAGQSNAGHSINDSRSHETLPLHELGRVILATENYIEHGGKFLMHRRSPTKSRFPGFLVGPGGRIDEGEDVIVAAAREIKEETGISLTTPDIKLKVVAIHRHLDREEIWVNFITYTKLIQTPEVIVHSDEGTSEWLSVNKLLTEHKVFEPSKVYFEHVLKDQPGVMYTNSEWREARLVRILSQTTI